MQDIERRHFIYVSRRIVPAISLLKHRRSSVCEESLGADEEDLLSTTPARTSYVAYVSVTDALTSIQFTHVTMTNIIMAVAIIP